MSTFDVARCGNLIVPRIKLKALPFATAWLILAVDRAGWCDGQNGESPSITDEMCVQIAKE